MPPCWLVPADGVVLSLAVVIPTLGRHTTLRRVLDLLARHRAEAGPLEVVVAADARESDLDSLREAVAGRPWPAQLVQGASAGASSARNAGWRAARSDLVLFLGDDILPRAGLLAGHLARHAAEPGEDVGVLGLVSWAPELGRSAFMVWLDHGMQFDYPSIEGDEAGWGRFNTANASVKRALLVQADGFDEGLPFLYEDLDLARRFHERGFRLLYERGAVGEHLHRPTLDDWRTRMEMVGQAERRFVDKHPDVEPYFHDMLSRAAAAPAARGRAAPLIRWLPRSFPVLGELAWSSADLLYRQQLAPPFLRGWEAAGRDG